MHLAVLLTPTRAVRASLAIVVLLGAGTLVARTRAQTDDAFSSVDTSDPSELARLVDRVGDDAVIARLSSDETAATRLLAIRATPQLDGPERALEALAAIASGRDPDLAPAAAISLVAIARALDPQALDAREVMREELTPARAALAPITTDETARPDVRRAAELVIAALDAIGVPPGET